jgi:hypothetical protein
VQKPLYKECILVSITSVAENSDQERKLPKADEKPLPCWLLVFSIAGLGVLGAVMLFPNWTLRKVMDREQVFFGERHLAYALHNVPSTKEGSPMQMGIKRLEDVFGQRLEQYQKNVESLSRNLLYQAIFICLALLVILRRQDKYEIPVLNLEVPRGVSLLLVPAGLVVLWSQFGFLLSETIDLRMGLWKIAEAVEQPKSAMVDKPITVVTSMTSATERAWLGLTNAQMNLTAKDWTDAAYTYGYKRVLHDGGFLDGWFNSFRIDYTLPAKSILVLKSHVVLWGIFCGLANACLLACIWERGKSRDAPWVRGCLGLLFLGATVYVALSHWAFLWGGGHPNWMQPLSLLVGAFLFWILAAGLSIPQTVVKKISSWFPSGSIP